MQALVPRRDEEEVAMLKEASKNPFGKNSKDGYLNMAVAENNIMVDKWKEKMEEISKNEALPDSVWKYGDIQG